MTRKLFALAALALTVAVGTADGHDWNDCNVQKQNALDQINNAAQYKAGADAASSATIDKHGALTDRYNALTGVSGQDQILIEGFLQNGWNYWYDAVGYRGQAAYDLSLASGYASDAWQQYGLSQWDNCYNLYTQAISSATNAIDEYTVAMDHLGYATDELLAAEALIEAYEN